MGDFTLRKAGGGSALRDSSGDSLRQTVHRVGAAAPTLPFLSASGSVTVVIAGFVAFGSPSLPALSASGAVAHRFTSTGTPTLPALTSSGVGHSHPAATGTPTLPKLTASGVGLLVPRATGSPSLPSLSASASAHTDITASAAPSLPALTASGLADVPNRASGSPSLPALSASGLAFFPVSASGSPSLSFLSAAASGGVTGSGGLYFASVPGSVRSTYVIPLPTGGVQLGGAGGIVKSSVSIPPATGGLLFSGSGLVEGEGGIQFGGQGLVSSSSTAVPFTPAFFYTPSLASVYIRSSTWPFQRIAELTSASGIDRSYITMAPGAAAFHISPRDQQIHSNVLEAGNVVEIASPVQPPWIGSILRFKETYGGDIEVMVKDWLENLNGRIAIDDPAGDVVRRSVSQIARMLIVFANMGDPTGFTIPRFLEPGPGVQIPIGGESVLEQLEDLYNHSGYEFWPEYRTEPGLLEATINIGLKQGADYSHICHLYEGEHYSVFDYTLDFSNILKISKVTGSLGTRLTDKASVTRSRSQNPSSGFLGNHVEPSTPLAVRAAARNPAGLRNEGVLYEVTAGDNRTELARRAEREDLALPGAEMPVARVNRKADWRYLQVGNTITLHADLALGDIGDPYRIQAVQSSEEEGICEVVFKSVVQQVGVGVPT